MAASILRKKGYRVIDASCAADALKLADGYDSAINLLLTDVVMPHMSGAELARRLVATRPQLKVLCMSGYTDDSIVRHGVLDAHFPYLQKPITPESLATRVRQVLDAS